MLFWIVIFLTPAAFLSVLQGVDLAQRDVTGMRERLIQSARATADDTDIIVTSAERILTALSSQPEIRQSTGECGAALSGALKGRTYFTDIMRVGPDGEVLCTSAMPDLITGVASQPWWIEARVNPSFFIAPHSYGETARPSILTGVLPLRDGVGDFDGALAIAFDNRWLSSLLESAQIPSDAAIAIFDASGKMIAANNADIAAAVFRDVTLPVVGNAGPSLASGPNGENWFYTLAPLSAGNAYLALATRDTNMFSGTYLQIGANLMLPLLMVLAAAAIWIATDRQVTRWLVYLRRFAVAYTHGHYAIRPVALEEAPSEFRPLGEAFSRMAAAIQDRDQRLRDAVAQKTLLIKETHHRVKNNLQIVMSLLSLQAAQLRDPAAQSALRQAQVRVNALALVHRILHDIEDQGAVDLKLLLEDLVRQIHEGFGGDRRELSLEVDIVSRMASGDIAVPVTLFTVEALTNAFKYAYPLSGRAGTIRVAMRSIGSGKLSLTIEDDGVGCETYPSQAGSPQVGIGWRLIQAFSQQVAGAPTIAARQGGGTIVTLTFPDPAPDTDAKEATDSSHDMASSG